MKKKIYLLIDESDLPILKDMIEKAKSESLQVAAKLSETKEDEYIRVRVVWALSDISGINVNDIKDGMDLKFDLGLTNYHKRALKRYFQNVVSELGSDKVVSVRECEKLKKVSDCVDLVKSKL